MIRSLALTLIAGILASCSLIMLPTPSGSPTPGLGQATWALPQDETIGPDTRSFTALVTERGCASGQSSAGRIVDPTIAYRADAVVVTFRVRGLGGIQSCPGNPATAVIVQLKEPLGTRSLLDGGLGQPKEPPVCAAPPSCT